MGFDFLDFGFPKSGTDWKSINGKPFITVSAKGRSNQLSNKINDGADFGVDTTLNATSPSQIGAPYTETSGIQEAINYAISLGYAIKLASGQFIINSTITIPHAVTIQGQGIFSYPTFSNYPLGDASSEPLIYETSSVIVNNTIGDAIDITVNYEAVNLDNFGVLMTKEGGTGIKCSPSNPTTQMGMVYSHWGTVIVYSEVIAGSNYAFWFDNIGLNTFNNLQSENMLTIHINSLSDNNTGNSTFLSVFGQPPSNNTDNAVKIESTGTYNQLTNYIHFVYLQIQIGNPINHSIYVGSNVTYITISFVDLEATSTSSLAMYIDLVF